LIIGIEKKMNLSLEDDVSLRNGETYAKAGEAI
jgi:hypothetical protein